MKREIIFCKITVRNPIWYFTILDIIIMFSWKLAINKFFQFFLFLLVESVRWRIYEKEMKKR